MDNELKEFIDAPISVTSVEDGWVFKFSTEVLEQLLEQAEESGNVVVFVKSQSVQGN